MRKIFFLLFLFSSIFSFSQDIETLKKSDTLYILFEKKSNQTFFEAYHEKLKLKTIFYKFITQEYYYGFDFFVEEKDNECNRKIVSYKNYMKIQKKYKNKFIFDFISLVNNNDYSGLFSKNEILKIIYIVDITNINKIYISKVKSMKSYFGDD